MYEMMCGRLPFYSREHEKLFEQILQCILRFPSRLSIEAKSLLSSLLVKDPTNRLGGGPDDAQDIRNHEFFKTMDWEKLYRKEIEPPFKVGGVVWGGIKYAYGILTLLNYSPSWHRRPTRPTSTRSSLAKPSNSPHHLCGQAHWTQWTSWMRCRTTSSSSPSTAVIGPASSASSRHCSTRLVAAVGTATTSLTPAVEAEAVPEKAWRWSEEPGAGDREGNQSAVQK